jgi:hypothetical protein
MSFAAEESASWEHCNIGTGNSKQQNIYSDSKYIVLTGESIKNQRTGYSMAVFSTLPNGVQ